MTAATPWHTPSAEVTVGEVRVEEHVEAPPPAVWAVLSDVGGWADWNDVMVDGRCDRPEPGGVISFRLAIGPGLPVKARLVSWTPERDIVWGEDRGRILRLTLRGERPRPGRRRAILADRTNRTNHMGEHRCTTS